MEIKNKEIRLEFNMGLYSYDSIILAADEFSKNFWVMADKFNDKIIIHLKPKPEFIKDMDMKNLGHEFYNYALGLMQKHPIKQ